MDEREIARRVLEAAEKKGGNVFLSDLPRDDIEYARSQGWLGPVGIGHFQVTDAGRAAASG